MLIQPSSFPPVPTDTIRAAEEVFGRGNVYLDIGDRLEQLLTGVPLSQLDASGERPASALAVLALVTIFQFAEDLPDRRAAEATRTRTDWKYALRLPLNHPGFSYSTLCEFRQYLGQHSAARQIFQQMLDRLTETGLLRNTARQPLGAIEVLGAVCAMSRLERLIEAMHMALEAIAACEPEWLLAATLPHWYERYNQMLSARIPPKSSVEQATLAQAIQADALYLLEAIAGADSHLALLPEVQSLQKIGRQPFNPAPEPLAQRSLFCAACT